MTNPAHMHSEPGAGIDGLPALIVLGRDEAGKPHASWFGRQDAPLAAKAAGLMGMSSLQVKQEALRTLAARLPKGRVFASGKAFVPFVKGDLYDRLAAHLPAGSRQAGVHGAKKPSASASSGVEGRAASSEGGPVSSSSEPVAGQPAAGDDWSRIRAGRVVLASAGKGEPWYEATVLQEKGEHLTLRWQDYPDEPDIVRRREQVALLHPKLAWPGAR